MAQYYQVTSLEELHRLYPNLQLDNLEGVPCMIQEDQVSQYSDGQGHQVITTVEQSGIQISHEPSAQQCTAQQSQFLVHQPTQYIIRQMETSESQTPHYMDPQQTVIQNKEEMAETQEKKKGCTAIENEEHSIQQNIMKQDVSQQFVPQVQPVMHQPIQIHQQIQALDMGGNILVLQNHEQHDLMVNQNEKPELISCQTHLEKPQHIIIQEHQQQKSQVITQKPQVIQKEENPQICSQLQVAQNRRPSLSGNQSQVVHQPQQQVIQQLQYFNQVTVIDSLPQPNAVEHRTPSSENLNQAQQVQSQVNQQILNQQQFKSRKSVQQNALPTLIQQPQQMLIPQRYEISPLRIPHPRKKIPQQDEVSSTPVFIVQKLDSPFLIRQPQTKIRFQTPPLSNEKINENLFSNSSIQPEPNLENVTQENQQLIQSTSRNALQIESHQHAANLTGMTPPNKFSERNHGCNTAKLGVSEQPFGNKMAEQTNKPKNIPVHNRSPVSRIKTTEQQTEPIDTPVDGKEIAAQNYEHFVSGLQPQFQSQISPSQLQLQPKTSIQNQIPMSGRGRGVRANQNIHSSRGGHQHVPRGRGVQVQTSPPRPPNVEDAVITRKLKSYRGGNRGGRGGWVSCGIDQRQQTPARVTPQVVQTAVAKSETNVNPSENTEEARMVVLLLNGERKMVRIPCSQQNILLNQILQQAGLQLSCPASLTIEQVMESGSDQSVNKSSPTNNQPQLIPAKPCNITQSVTVPNSVVTPRSIVATIHQQRPRVQPSHIPQNSPVGIVRHRVQISSHRMTFPNSSTSPSTNLMSEGGTLQSQINQNSTPPLQPPKEEPRFVKGLMAICPFCGISSLDFNKCIRCRRKLPENVKSQSIFNVKKKKVEKATVGNEKNSEVCESESEEKSSEFLSSEEKEKNILIHSYDRKKSKSCVKKKKIHEEPAEILILSSDEEEEGKSKKTPFNQQTLTVLRKEPIYSSSELPNTEMTYLVKENLNEDLMKNVQPGSFTTLQCRTIRIGSYKVQPKERIFLSSKGIRMVVNSLKNESTPIVIPFSNIIKVLIHFGVQVPVIFIYPSPKVGFHIRCLLGMDDKSGPYYDPASTEDETHKRITLLLEKITEDSKLTLYRIFESGKLEELSEKEANEILIRSSSIEMIQSNINKSTDIIRKIMIYPPPPEKGGITLNNQDYACLGEDQFLNDVIIDFYLKYLTLKVLSPEDRNRTHVFSTFFYKRLTTKPKTIRKNDPENDPKLSPAEKRHLRVKGWTKQVNLFEKDFIIVPINEHSHWFLAIICFPGLNGPVRFSDNMPVEPEEIPPKKNTQSVQIGSTTITQIIKSDCKTNLEMDSTSDRDEAEGDQDDLHPSSDEESEQAEEEMNTSQSMVQIPLLTPLASQQASPKESKPKSCKKKPLKEPIKQPCILIFDSLAGASRVRVVATLRDYLKIEYKKKMGQDKDFSKTTIKGAVPKVPQQNNFTDCGLYVLQYVESFFQDPLHDFKLPLKYLQDWFPEEVVSSKRQKLASLIRALMEEQGLKVEEMGLPVLTFTNGGNPTDDQSKMEEEEEGEEEEEDEEGVNEGEEILRNRVHISEFENEDDDMELGDEEEDEDEEEDLDEDDDEEDEELEVGEIPRSWSARSKNSCNELESSIKHVGGQILIRTAPLVDYNPSDSEGIEEEEEEIDDEEEEEEEEEGENGGGEEDSQMLLRGSERVILGEMGIGDERHYCESDQSLSVDKRKSVPLTELQDFESQISCTTIEKNVDSKNSESDMVISEEDDDEEEQCGIATSEETSDGGYADSLNKNFNQSVSSSEKNIFSSNKVLVKENKAIEVTDIIQKLVNDKNITISRKDEESNSNLFNKHLQGKKIKLQDCDKSDEEKSQDLTLKNNLAACKRSYQPLKSVRIPKKADRQSETSHKRQKIDER